MREGVDDMEKRKYYVGVASGQITQQPESTHWEYEIEASDEEIARLRDLFENANRQNMGVAYVALHPVEGRKEERDFRAYSQTLQEVYRMIYELGNDEAREHIVQNKIIEDIGKDYM